MMETAPGRQSGGTVIEAPGVVIRAYNLLAEQGDFGLYLVSGTAAELTALDASPQCAGGVALAWPAVNVAIPNAIRLRINAWLAARGLPTVPSGWTWLQLLRRVKANWDAGGFELMDG